MQRRHHYEQAFESYLRTRRIPYVAVDEAKRALLPGAGDFQAPHAHTPGILKSFDFVVYAPGGNLLVEVKGRRLRLRNGRARNGSAAARLECWAFRDDIDSLLAWESLFGPEFAATLAFLYCCDAQPADGLFEEIFEHRSAWYAILTVSARAFREHMKTRSERWRTVDLPTRVFRQISEPFSIACPTAALDPAAERLAWGVAG